MFEQGSTTDTEIAALVEQMEQADTALAVHVQRIRRTGDPVCDLLEIRAAILRWCADPQVARWFGSECVRATAAAVHAMTLREFLDYVCALDYLARRASLRTRGVA
jgi:hypothetical protein